MKIFITGATGFIGSHLVEKLVSDGHDITINLRSQKSFLNKDVKFYHLEHEDIENDIDFFRRESFDGIIHLASLYLTNHKSSEVVNLINSNIKFGAYLLECSSQAKVKWFINTGTFWQNHQNYDYSPVNLYAATKQAFENIARYYIETNQIKFNTIRLADTFGPNDKRPKIFNLWEKIAKSGETLDMSPGEQTIDISYIDDVINAFVILARHLQNNDPRTSNGKVYAVLAEQRFNLKELSLIFEEVINKKLNINWGKKSYREREVMMPWEHGEVVPDWKPAINIKTAIKYFLDEE